MPSTLMRVREDTRETLRELASQTGEPIQEVLRKAVESYRRQLLLEATNAAYARLRADPKAWSEELREREAWEATLDDGLEDG